MKKLLSCFMSVILLFIFLPYSAAAEDSENYVWVLKETVEYDKQSEIEDYNNRNSGVYSLKISGSKGSFVFTLNYLGQTLDQGNNGRYLKEGDNASSSVAFSKPPRIIKPDEQIGITADLRILSDNTYDKAHEFLLTKATAFFDRPGARPDIPSSNAVYLTEKEGEEKGTSVGTKSGASTNISASLYSAAPKINDERKMVLCVCAEGILAVGTKYVYELTDEKAANESDQDQSAFRKASVRNIEGSVSLADTEGKNIILKNDDIVTAGSSVKTGTSSGCELLFDDKSFFNISEDSELLLDKAEVKDTVLRMKSGKAWAYIQPVVYDGSFIVEMKYASIKIKGTIFALDEGQDSSTIWLFTGVASIISTKTGEATEIQAGRKATYDKDGNLKLEYFNVNENIDQWGIPVSAIREDSGYSWVKYFLIGLAVLTAATFGSIYMSGYLKKRKKLKSISDTVPQEGQCQYCGNRIGYEDTFCKVCGAAIKRTKYNDNDKN